MSETWDPDHALPASYLSYKRQACDRKNRPVDELWNSQFREEFDKWVHLQSESDNAEWVYWASHSKTADSTSILYNHLLGKAGTGGKHRRMSWSCIYAVLCNSPWSEESIRNGGKGKGWAARAAAAYPNANIRRGQSNEEQADVAITGQPETNNNTEEPIVTGRPTKTARKAQSARYKSQLKTKRGKDRNTALVRSHAKERKEGTEGQEFQ